MVNSIKESLLQTSITCKTIPVSTSSWPWILNDLSRSAKFKKQVLSTTKTKYFSKLATSLAARYLVSSFFVLIEARNLFVSRCQVLYCLSPYSLLEQFLWFYRFLCFPSQIWHHINQILLWLHQIWMLRFSLAKC